jgi:O-antigen/teichoic acid export membrane protein
MDFAKKIIKNDYSFATLAFTSQFGFAFLSFMILLRTLTPEDLGQWIIFLAIVTLSELARTGLIQNGYIKFLKEKKFDSAQLNSSAFSLNLITGVILSILVVLISIPLKAVLQVPTLTDLCIIYPFFVIVAAPLKFIEIQWIATNRFGRMAITKSIYGICFLLLIAVISVTGKLTLKMLPFLQVLAVMITVSSAVIFLKGRIWFSGIQKNIVNELVKYGKYVLGTNIGSIILNKMDIFLLGAITGPVSVAIYNAASKLMNVVEIPLTSISQVCFPKIANAFHQESPQSVGKIYVKGLILAFAALLPLCLSLFIFAKPIILFVAGEQYLGGIPILKILALAVFIKPLGRFLGITLDAIGQPDLNFYLLLCSIVFNLIFSLIFIQWWGTIGVAFAALTTASIVGVFGQIILHKIIPIFQYRPFRN